MCNRLLPIKWLRIKTLTMQTLVKPKNNCKNNGVRS
jgi:hypothetical protein